jgi:hypothetical protein
LVKLDCRGENDGEARGAALPDAELESAEHVVQLEEITNPSLEPLLQEVSSEVNRQFQISSRRAVGFRKFLPNSRPCHLFSMKSQCFENCLCFCQ